MPYRCEHCGAEYEEWPGKFCERCGRALARIHFEPEEEEEKKRCGKCGHLNPPDKTVCINCGEKLYIRKLG